MKVTERKKAIGVDIGGSHISSAVVDLETYQVETGTFFSGSVNNKVDKEEIFKKWASVINQSLKAANHCKEFIVGIAMPGPFQYEKGVALFEVNDKYESLYGVSVKDELPNYLIDNKEIRFINDASAFGVGCSLLKESAGYQKIISITLGTGFGAAFIDDHKPIVHAPNVPVDGCLWDKPFLSGIADDFFSTRWFLSSYNDHTGNDKISGVKELVVTKSDCAKVIFEEFAINLSNFLLEFAKNFETDLLMIGGNIAKSHHLFIPKMNEIFSSYDFPLPIVVVDNTDKSVIIGASMLAKESYWNQIKDNLPTI